MAEVNAFIWLIPKLYEGFDWRAPKSKIKTEEEVSTNDWDEAKLRATEDEEVREYNRRR